MDHGVHSENQYVPGPNEWGPTTFARGNALAALRDMGASRAVLEQVAAM